MRRWSEQTRRVGWPQRTGGALGLAALFGLATFMMIEPVAAHEAELDTRLELVLHRIVILDDLDPHASGEWRFLVYADAVEEDDCGQRAPESVRANPAQSPLARFEFAADGGDEKHLDRTATIELNSEHGLCLRVRASEEDGGLETLWGDIADMYEGRSAGRTFTRDEDWGVGSIRRLRTQHYFLEYEIRNATATVGEPPVRRTYGDSGSDVLVKPDLVVSGIRVTDDEAGTQPCRNGERNHAWIKVKNRANVAAGPFVVRVIIDGKDKERSLERLEPGEEVELRFAEDLRRQEHLVEARADQDDAVDESNEDNNDRTYRFTCGG